MSNHLLEALDSHTYARRAFVDAGLHGSGELAGVFSADAAFWKGVFQYHVSYQATVNEPLPLRCDDCGEIFDDADTISLVDDPEDACRWRSVHGENCQPGPQWRFLRTIETARASTLPVYCGECGDFIAVLSIAEHGSFTASTLCDGCTDAYLAEVVAQRPCVCGQAWPCPESARKDVSGVYRASHYVPSIG